jgi:group I intron endonuclease
MKDNNNVIPIVTYNASRDKSNIYTENKNKSGIYRWNNLTTGKCYVGSSKCLASRLSIYYSKKAMLNKLSTRTSIIYSALLKYGYNSFSVDILEYCEIDVLVEREQYYLDILKPKYNILKAANSRLGSKHTLETRALMSVKQKGINHPFFGKTLSHETRIKISEALKSSIVFKDSFKVKPRFRTPETILKLSLKSNGVSVKLLDKWGNILNTFPSINKAAKHIGIASSTIRRLPNNGTYGSFVFKFEINDVRVWVYDQDRNLVKVLNNTKETSERYNIPRHALCAYIRSGKLYKNKFYFYKINTKPN